MVPCFQTLHQLCCPQPWSISLAIILPSPSWSDIMHGSLLESENNQNELLFSKLVSKQVLFQTSMALHVLFSRFEGSLTHPRPLNPWQIPTITSNPSCMISSPASLNTENLPLGACSSVRSGVVQTVKNLPAVQETWVPSLGREDGLKKGTATHSSILAWRIPRTETPRRGQSMGSQRAGHD